jgi:RHS repeat-associated protein
MKAETVRSKRLQIFRHIALSILVLLVACGHPGGAVEDIGSHADRSLEDPAPGPTPPPPRPTALLGWPSTPVIASETTGTLPGEGGVGVAGDYRYTLPIEVPPGRAGMEPSLSLAYSSTGENGIAGVGWSLTGLSTISECNKTFATDGAALESAALCLDGQRLVPSGEASIDVPVPSALPSNLTGATSATVSVWRTEFDTFARIEMTTLSGFGPGLEVIYSFKVLLKDGRIRTYAYTWQKREHVLAKEEDRFGNTITYEYARFAEPKDYNLDHPAPIEDDAETPHLSKILYTGRSSNGELGSRWVALSYEDRTDAIFVTSTSPAPSSKKRLKSIDCYAPAPAPGTSVSAPSLAWSYELKYTPSPYSGRSRLVSVKRRGSLGSAQLAREFDWESTQGGAYESPNFALPQGDTAGDYLVLDVDHDGRDELLYSLPVPFMPAVMYSTPGAGPPLSQVTAVPGLENARFTDASVGDIDGDGIPEIIAPDRTGDAAGNKLYQVYKWSSTTKSYFAATQANQPWESYHDPVLSKGTEQPIFLVDMDGDGLVDMIQAQYPPAAFVLDSSCVAAATPDRPKCLWYNWYYFHNDGGIFGPAQLMAESTLSMLLPPRSGSPFSASVVTDLAGRSEFGGVQVYWPTTGTTYTGSFKIAGNDGFPTMPASPRYKPQCAYGNFTGRGSEPVCDKLPSPWRTTVFDFDGDGRDELFEYTGLTINGEFHVFANNHVYFDGLGVRHEELVQQTPLVTGDFNGDGLQDAILYDQALGKTFAALNAGSTHDLMTGVRNETALKPMEIVQYSQRWSADPVIAKACAHPQRCIRQGMNVVVERDVYQGSDVDVYEHSLFNYEDPRSDVHGRGFLGFGTVREWNPDRLTETITEYDNITPVDGVYFTAMPRRVSHYAAITSLDGSLRHYSVRGSVVNTSYAVDTPTPATYFLHPTTWDSVEWETDATVDVTVGLAKHFIFTNPAPTPLRQRNGEFSFGVHGDQTYSRSEVVGGVKTEVSAVYDAFPLDWLIGELTQTLTTVTEPGGGAPTPRQVNYTYGSKGELEAIDYEQGYTNPDPEIGYTVTFEYNADGLPIHTTGWAATEGLRNAFMEYDPEEGIFPRTVWNNLGHTVWTLYHPAFGVVSDEISANGVETQIVFDGLGRTRKISRDGEAPVLIHSGPRSDAGGKLVGSYVDTSGAGVASTHSEYNEHGRLLLQSHVGFDGNSIFSKTQYDSLGRLQFASRAGFGQPAAIGTTYEYDGLSRVVSVTAPDGKSTRATHLFFETRTVDSMAHASHVVRDVNGRVAQSVDEGDSGAHASITCQYGNFNQIKSITDSKNNISRISYDQRGRRVSIRDPDAGVSTFHYNGFGDLTELDVPGINGSAVPAQTIYQRDDLGRVVHIDNGDGATDFTWDKSLYGIGLLASQSSSSVAQTFAYDWYGRPSKETWTVGQESFDVLMSYDSLGRVSSVSYPNVPGRQRFKVQRNYTSTNYLASLEEVDPTNPLKLWEVLARNADDQLLAGQFGNGRLSKRTYEPAMGRLKTIADMGCVGVNCIGAEYSLAYTYYDDGNVQTRTDSAAARAEQFSYDALNRLKSWTLSAGGSERETSYGYDAIGNLTEVKVGGSVTESNTYFPSGIVPCAAVLGSPCPGPHALASTTAAGVTRTFDYDTRGRQIAAPERRVDFSEANLPTEIRTNAGSTVFSYDAAGSRVKKVGPAEETVTLGGFYERRVTEGGTQHVFFVAGGDGNLTQVTFTQGAPSSEKIEYLHTDALGSTGAVTDDTGGITRFYHEPFGARIDATGAAFSGTLGDVRLGFTGQVSDDDLGLVNMKGRIYSPSQRHFITPDPLVSAPATAQSYNRYSYVRNNPLYFTDPSGLDEEPPPSPAQPTPPDSHTNTGGGPSSPGQERGNWPAYHTNGGASPSVQATPFKGSPAPGGGSNAAGVHHDRHIMLDLEPEQSWWVRALIHSGDREPGARAAKAGIVFADWARTGVPPDGPELKVALNGVAGMVKQAAPLLETVPKPDAAVTRSDADPAPVPVSPPAEGQIVPGVPVGRFDTTVLAGHGREPDGLYTIVPEGTDVLLPKLHLDNNRLDDFLGNYLEKNGEDSRVTLEYFPPGTLVPNLILSPPVNPFLHTEPTSTTVRAPTYLSDILKPNMGVCVWAACRVPLPKRE